LLTKYEKQIEIFQKNVDFYILVSIESTSKDFQHEKIISRSNGFNDFI